MRSEGGENHRPRLFKARGRPNSDALGKTPFGSYHLSWRLIKGDALVQRKHFIETAQDTSFACGGEECANDINPHIAKMPPGLLGGSFTLGS